LGQPRRLLRQSSSLVGRGGGVEEAFLAIVRPSRVHDVINPRIVLEKYKEPAWVSDPGGILSEEERERVNELCHGVHAAWRVEMAVVVLDSLPPDIHPSGFAAALLNYWGVGDRRLHTGIVALLLHGQRRLEIRVGFGVGRVLTAEALRAIQQERMLPHLKVGMPGAALEDMVRGVHDALDAGGPPHWRRKTAREPDRELNQHGFLGGQTPIDEFLPPKSAEAVSSGAPGLRRAAGGSLAGAGAGAGAGGAA